ncbi:MAG: hypothetical protein IPN44_07495 [Flavobacteriales bacterium]|nr:hypothetical protein [Flavobacteriales bacterium]
MFKASNLPLLIFLILCLNVVIYIRASLTIVPVDMVFGECARNSGRTSAAINLYMLFMVGHYGLKSIYADEKRKNVFRVLITLFAVNHLVHFLFVSHYFKDKLLELNISHNLHGFITYLFIVAAPILLWRFNTLSKVLYYGIMLHLFNVTYLICITFYARYKPVDPAYLHRLGILVILAALGYILYRIYRERTIEFPRPQLCKPVA